MNFSIFGLKQLQNTWPSLKQHGLLTSECLLSKTAWSFKFGTLAIKERGLLILAHLAYGSMAPQVILTELLSSLHRRVSDVRAE